MRAALRVPTRLLVIGGVLLTAAGMPARAATPPEKTLPASTLAFAKINDAAALREALKQSQFGRMLADPAMKPLTDDVKARTKESSDKLKQRLGVSIKELWELPQGAVSVAVLSVEDPKLPVAVLLSADAGKNDAAMQEVMTKATKQAEQSGDKVTTESFKGATITVITPAKPAAEGVQPVAAWAKLGTVYYFSMAGTTDPLKDVLTNVNGRADSLADTESYVTVSKKIGTPGQVAWYVDFGQATKLLTQAAARQGIAPEQITAQLQLLGINGLKAIGGTYSLNTGDYDSVSKSYLLAPAPLQGLLRIFKLPKTALKPEPWVPATVAAYQTFNWDLDNAYTAIDDLANMLVPGLLQNLQQNIGGPGGGIDFKKDLIGPLGNRISIISDYKKPVTETSQRSLFAISLDDAKAAQATLNKLVTLLKANPTKREFQGTTIYNFDLPAMPNAPGGAAPQGPVALAIAKETLFLSTEPTLLEQVLRPGAAGLADSPLYQAVAKELPSQASGISFQKPEENARVIYDMLKGGQFQKALENANPGGNVPKVSDVIDVKKLPDFSVFAKYLLQGGGYIVTDEDGASFTQFTLRKANP